MFYIMAENTTIVDEKEITENDKLHKYNCELCYFHTNKKYSWERHLTTTKHKTQVKIIEEKDIDKNKYKCECGEYLNSRTTLWRHKKKCKKEFENNSELTDKQIIEYLIKENKFLKSVYSKLSKNENNI